MVRSVFDYGVIGRAIKKGILDIKPVDLRDFAVDKHRSVDDKPFGGGPGMVMRVDVIDRALQKTMSRKQKTMSKKIVLLSPRGKMFSQQIAQEYSRLDHLILISGRYEGVDERVKEHLVDEEVSIGEYVLSGGEIPAMAVADAMARLLPGVLGDPESLVSESFSQMSNEHPPAGEAGKTENKEQKTKNSFDFPNYTQPAEYKGWKVPEVLRLGNHGKIKEWREEKVSRFLVARILGRRG